MKSVLYRLIIIALPALLLAGCIQSLGGSKLDVPPLAKDFNSMPLEAEAIVSAMAVQTVTPPLEGFGSVTFGPGAEGPSEIQLALDGFEFTGATLYAFTEAKGTAPGLTAAEIEYTDPLERKATFLFRAEYLRMDDGYTITKLDVQRSYTPTPRIQVSVVPFRDLPANLPDSYAEFIALIADRGLTPEQLRSAPKQVYAIFAVGKDWAAPGSEMSIAISAKKIGRTGYKKASNSFLLKGWPVGVVVGTIDPGSRIDELYAKITYRKGSGGFASLSQFLGSYQLSDFKE